MKLYFLSVSYLSPTGGDSTIAGAVTHIVILNLIQDLKLLLIIKEVEIADQVRNDEKKWSAMTKWKVPIDPLHIVILNLIQDLKLLLIIKEVEIADQVRNDGWGIKPNNELQPGRCVMTTAGWHRYVHYDER